MNNRPTDQKPFRPFSDVTHLVSYALLAAGNSQPYHTDPEAAGKAVRKLSRRLAEGWELKLVRRIK